MRRASLLITGSAIAACLTMLAACGDREPEAEALPPPPEAAPLDVTDFSRPLNAIGNEPFWALTIRPDGLTFSAPDQSDVTAANPGPEVAGAEAIWTGDADGQPVRATLRAEVCQDGMSGLHYPFTATVEIDGRTLEGCASYADAMPREAG